ncbi:MAG: hypothetical protein AW07_03623 [Candidatus Accumulibacter sp. SK-11]|nr:MAG: hypothetical protein AW07_03623 [Candidatus Accumulibacter sp. SK-11]
MASSSSTPAAPPPTTAIVSGCAAASPAAASSRARCSSASQRSLKPLIGFTGTTCMLPSAPRSMRGVEPTLIDSRSHDRLRPLRQCARRAPRSMPVTSSATKRAPAKAASRGRSMCTWSKS